jgi:serine O-acetyltransferase
MIVIKYLIYFPLLVRFWTSNQKDLIIQDLLAQEIDVNSHDINTNFINRIAKDNYFRSVFYFRTRSIFTNVLRFFYPKEKYFIIDINTKIGGGIKLAHPFSTIINAECIGENLYINHLVTIGEKNGKKPIIGNNVQLHANCSVIGGIKIGNNVIIGAGAVITKDVPENSIVIGAKNRFLESIIS